MCFQDILWVGLGFVALYLAYEKVIRKPRVKDIHSKFILITGCDSGFGRHSALNFDRLGCHVIAACLTESAVKELHSEGSSRLFAVQLDVSDDTSVAEALTKVKKHIPSDKGLWALVNNAGVMGPTGPMEWMTPERVMEIFNINFFGMLRVTNAFLPLLKKVAGSRVINTASVVGRFPVPYSGAYSLSKFVVQAYSDNIRRELCAFGISVHIIEPGAHKTNFLEDSNVISNIQKTWNDLRVELQEEYGQRYLQEVIKMGTKLPSYLAENTPDKVVAAYEHAALARFPKTRYRVGRDSGIYLLGYYLPSWFTDWAFTFKIVQPQPAIVNGLKTG